jgi:hypothetical protein
MDLMPSGSMPPSAPTRCGRDAAGGGQTRCDAHTLIASPSTNPLPKGGGDGVGPFRS